MKKEDLFLKENQKLKRLQLMVDLTVQILYQSKNLDLETGMWYIKNAKKFTNILFPGKEEVFDLIYKPRFLRVLKERGVIKFSEN